MSWVPYAAYAATQVIKGYSQNKAYESQAGIYEQQAGQISAAQGLEGAQYDRKKGQLAGKLTARVAKSGLAMSGSPVAVLVDSLTQIEMDKQTGQYNLEVEKRYALSGAALTRLKGKQAITSGWGDAFQTMLSYGVGKYGNKNVIKTNPYGGGSVPSYKPSRFGGYSIDT